MTEHHLRDERAGWFALAMNAAASLEDATNCSRDPEAKAFNYRGNLGAAIDAALSQGGGS